MAFPSRSAPDPGSLRSVFAPARPAAGYSPSETVRACIPRQRATRPRGEHTRERLWLVTVILELVPSPCIARGVDVPGSTPDCNIPEPGGLACGTHNALAVQSLQETPEPRARHH